MNTDFVWNLGEGLLYVAEKGPDVENYAFDYISWRDKNTPCVVLSEATLNRSGGLRGEVVKTYGDLDLDGKALCYTGIIQPESLPIFVEIRCEKAEVVDGILYIYPEEDKISAKLPSGERITQKTTRMGAVSILTPTQYALERYKLHRNKFPFPTELT